MKLKEVLPAVVSTNIKLLRKKTIFICSKVGIRLHQSYARILTLKILVEKSEKLVILNTCTHRYKKDVRKTF